MAGERVLVIDDSATITKVVQLVLTKSGYDVATAPDGEAGLVEVRAHRPDVILLDFVMPKMNGYQFCRELTADPKLRDIPVVLMSAKGDQVGERDDAQVAAQAGHAFAEQAEIDRAEHAGERCVIERGSRGSGDRDGVGRDAAVGIGVGREGDELCNSRAYDVGDLRA